MKAIVEHNSQNGETHVMGLNHLADMTQHEKKMLLGLRPSKVLRDRKEAQLNVTDIPASIDWRTKNAVTPV
jgi:KDEL-tailed cysteine endopeptidase